MSETIFFSQSEAIEMLNQMKPKQMKEVIRIEEQTKPNNVPVEFTHELFGEEGWEETTLEPRDVDKVVYLGKCSVDGDMFAGYISEAICIFKGHLNSGKY